MTKQRKKKCNAIRQIRLMSMTSIRYLSCRSFTISMICLRRPLQTRISFCILPLEMSSCTESISLIRIRILLKRKRRMIRKKRSRNQLMTWYKDHNCHLRMTSLTVPDRSLPSRKRMLQTKKRTRLRRLIAVLRLQQPLQLQEQKQKMMNLIVKKKILI